MLPQLGTLSDIYSFREKYCNNIKALEKDIEENLDLAVNSNKLKEFLSDTKNHPMWEIRMSVLKACEKYTNLDDVRDFIYNMTHDSVDIIAFKAIRLSGKIKNDDAVIHLVRISGWPSVFRRSDYLRKPVGIGASLTKKAMLDILGTKDIKELKEKEDKILAPFKEKVKQSKKTPSLNGMIKIPAGKSRIGTYKRDDFRFFYEDYIPEKEVELDEFYIDETPVTNSQYNKFLEDVKKNGPIYGHPDQPDNKDHTPTFVNDKRFNADDHPVVGVDWYDAYAYAKWAGKDLPTELQWEKAARGTENIEYPWGNKWNSEAAYYVENCFGRVIEDLEEWEECLRQFGDDFPIEPVKKVKSFPQGKSPYGVYDMSGNVWEWTKTNFYSKKDMDPNFKNRSLSYYTNKPAAFPVIRGGCCTSLPEMLKTFYRGKDLLTDRHFEIGFRCVVNHTK